MGVVAMNYYLLKEEVVLRQSIRFLPRHIKEQDDIQKRWSSFIYFIGRWRKKEKLIFYKRKAFLFQYLQQLVY